jgi:hypothetical protein
LIAFLTGLRQTRLILEAMQVELNIIVQWVLHWIVAYIKTAGAKPIIIRSRHTINDCWKNRVVNTDCTIISLELLIASQSLSRLSELSEVNKESPCLASHNLCCGSFGFGMSGWSCGGKDGGAVDEKSSEDNVVQEFHFE